MRPGIFLQGDAGVGKEVPSAAPVNSFGIGGNARTGTYELDGQFPLDVLLFQMPASIMRTAKEKLLAETGFSAMFYPKLLTITY